MNTLMADLGYYAEQQCSGQWLGFLRAFSAEFGAQGSPDELRAFMFRLGTTMARQYPLRESGSLPGLQTEMNQIWASIRWGWVRLEEKPGYLCIEHRCSPLKAAFGIEAVEWSPALLEGVYAQWFRELGVDGGLRLQQYGFDIDTDSIEFRLGR